MGAVCRVRTKFTGSIRDDVMCNTGSDAKRSANDQRTSSRSLLPVMVESNRVLVVTQRGGTCGRYRGNKVNFEEELNGR